jgi:hypothetical protein
MKQRWKRFSYHQAQEHPGLQAALPSVPLTLKTHLTTLITPALLDSGAMINVLPYDYGQRLGLEWGQGRPIKIGGFFGDFPAYGVQLWGVIPTFPPVQLVFAWTLRTSQDIPLILGQMNFFQQFRVLFDGRANAVEITPYE